MLNSSIHKLFSGSPLSLTKKKRIMEPNDMGKNQFLFIVANKMFLMIIDKGRKQLSTQILEKPWGVVQRSSPQLLMVVINYMYFLPSLNLGFKMQCNQYSWEGLRKWLESWLLLDLAPKEFTEIFSLIRTEFPPGGHRVILS